MKVIAQNDNWFVLQVTEVHGRVFDFERRRLFAPMSLVAILARGGWRDFEGDDQWILDALSDAHDLAPELANQESLRPATAA